MNTPECDPDFCRRCDLCGEDMHDHPHPDPMDEEDTLPADEFGEFVTSEGTHVICHAQCGLDREYEMA